VQDKSQGTSHPSKVAEGLEELAQMAVRLGEKVDVLTRDDELLGDDEKRLGLAALKITVGYDGRAPLLETRQRANLDAVEGYTVEGGPCWQGVNRLLEPASCSARADHIVVQPGMQHAGVSGEWDTLGH
jgi:hypothetical protein